MMKISIALAGLGLALSFVPPASAQDFGYGAPQPRVVYGAPPPLPGRTLTVVPRHRYDPYEGPKAVVTAPIHVASELVALPFRVVNGVFPARTDTPLGIVGVPVDAAGRVAQVPFQILQAPFGDRAIYGE